MEQNIIPTFLTGLTEELDNIKNNDYKNWIDFLLSQEMTSTYIFLIFSC